MTRAEDKAWSPWAALSANRLKCIRTLRIECEIPNDFTSQKSREMAHTKRVSSDYSKSDCLNVELISSRQLDRLSNSKTWLQSHMLVRYTETFSSCFKYSFIYYNSVTKQLLSIADHVVITRRPTTLLPVFITFLSVCQKEHPDREIFIIFESTVTLQIRCSCAFRVAHFIFATFATEKHMQLTRILSRNKRLPFSLDYSFSTVLFNLSIDTQFAQLCEKMRLQIYRII